MTKNGRRIKPRELFLVMGHVYETSPRVSTCHSGDRVLETGDFDPPFDQRGFVPKERSPSPVFLEYRNPFIGVKSTPGVSLKQRN